MTIREDRNKDFLETESRNDRSQPTMYLPYQSVYLLLPFVIREYHPKVLVANLQRATAHWLGFLEGRKTSVFLVLTCISAWFQAAMYWLSASWAPYSITKSSRKKQTADPATSNNDTFADSTVVCVVRGPNCVVYTQHGLCFCVGAAAVSSHMRRLPLCFDDVLTANMSTNAVAKEWFFFKPSAKRLYYPNLHLTVEYLGRTAGPRPSSLDKIRSIAKKWTLWRRAVTTHTLVGVQQHQWTALT